jgi:hypothetical protein
LLGTFAVLVIMTSTGQLGARAAPADGAGPGSSAGGTTIGPVQISALGHPSLCWEAGGNGSGVTLERCDHVIQGQQWSLTPNGVLMNGNGYCLEAVSGRPLFIDFAAQCAGAPTQLWHHHSGHLSSPAGSTPAGSTPAGSSPAGSGAAAGVCAVTAAPILPGAEITGGSCSRRGSSARAVSRWSIGYSAVTVTPGRGRGPAGGTFSASATVANAPSAQAAYGVSVAFTVPPGVSASTLRGSGLRCDVSTLTCTGTLPVGASRQITLTGPVPAAIRPGDTYPLHVHASVAGTTQRSRTARTTATLTVAVAPATPRPRSPLPLIAAGAAILLLGGLILILTTRRTRSSSRAVSSSSHRTPSRHAPQPPLIPRPPSAPTAQSDQFRPK